MAGEHLEAATVNSLVILATRPPRLPRVTGRSGPLGSRAVHLATHACSRSLHPVEGTYLAIDCLLHDQETGTTQADQLEHPQDGHRFARSKPPTNARRSTRRPPRNSGTTWRSRLKKAAPNGIVSRVTPVQTALRNCTRDEGGPFEIGNQGLISSHRKLLWSKAMVVSVAEKSGRDPVRQG
jgi:hypothetical protein